MDHQADLGRLETIIERLLESFRELKKENNRLEKALQQKEAAISRLQNEMEALHQEKNDVCQRVEGLIGSIEKWEQETMLHKANDLDDGQEQLELPAEQIVNIT